MKIVFFGTPLFAVPSLERLHHHAGFDVVAVVTQPDKRRGRGSERLPAPIKQVAMAYQIPVWQPRRVKKDLETLDQLRQTRADAFVVVAYGQILSQEILDMPRLGCINAHGSILPAYRGAAPIQWSLYHGEIETGVTTMLMDAGMDTGPVLLTGRTSIALLENTEDLAARLSQMSAELLVETLLQLDQGKIQPQPQNDADATYAPLIQKEDYRLDWSKVAIALHNQIRGFYPNCLTSLRGQALKVLASAPLRPEDWPALPPELQALRSQVSTLSSAQPPGSVVAIAKGHGPIVQTGEGLLLLRQVKPAGKRIQSGWDFANGSHLLAGEVLG